LRRRIERVPVDDEVEVEPAPGADTFALSARCVRYPANALAPLAFEKLPVGLRSAESAVPVSTSLAP
jgi:hypothetical protein